MPSKPRAKTQYCLLRAAFPLLKLPSALLRFRFRAGCGGVTCPAGSRIAQFDGYAAERRLQAAAPEFRSVGVHKPVRWQLLVLIFLWGCCCNAFSKYCQCARKTEARESFSQKQLSQYLLSEGCKNKS